MISLCVPSRGRPERAKMMRESAMDTAKDKDNLEIVWYLNEDDKSLPKYQSYFWPNVKIGPHQSTCMSWNQCAGRATQPIVALMGDDVLFKTKHWDLEIKKEFDTLRDSILEEAERMEREGNSKEDVTKNIHQNPEIKCALDEIELINEQIERLNKK